LANNRRDATPPDNSLWYQDIGVKREGAALAHGAKRFDEGLILAFAEKNLQPVIARAMRW
jgi:hypothetical protein